jgi:hypothetical protein
MALKITEERILSAARKTYPGRDFIYRAFEEHGQWWLTVDDPAEDNLRTFSVVECEARNIPYIGFEEL